jgi:hypothetical protein
MPGDRVFITGNGFSNVQGPVLNGPTTTTTTTKKVVDPPAISTATSATAITVLPGSPTVNLYREIFGFEKSFLDGAASVEVRVPVLQQTGDLNGFSTSDIGDLTIIGKYAILRDRATGNVLSGGLAVTAPTSPGVATTDGYIHSTLVQPFVGYLYNFDRFYVQAFHSVVVPTDSRDVTILFNDVGLNYWLYKAESNRVLNFVVPTVELHVTTPLDHRGAGAYNDINNPLWVPDMVVTTVGVHFGVFKNGTLTVGAATPVTAPRTFGVEGFVQLNWRF